MKDALEPAPGRRSLRCVGLAFALLLAFAAPAAADTAVVTPDGTLYEVYPARYADVVPSAEGTADAEIPVLALRTTLSGAPAQVEVINGTLDDSEEGSVSVEFDSKTDTLFVAYTKFQGLMADMHVALRRGTVWIGENILPNQGLYLSINPKVTVTRQSFVDFDGEGGTITTWRSIFSLVWWEESGPSQARYAAVFVEDGELKLSSVVAYNLNELGSAAGPTDATGLSLSAFVYPSVQRDPTTNGGVLVSFANLALRKQQVVRITFPDDITKLCPPGATSAPEEALARAHVPIGRSLGTGRLAAVPDNSTAELGAVASDKGVTTFYWFSQGALNFGRSDEPDGAAPKAITLKPTLGPDRAVSLVRELATRD